MSKVKRRAHSSIDRLPAELRDAVVDMIVDNIWPPDYPGRHDKGKPRYEDVVTYLKSKKIDISESAVGRFGRRMQSLASMKEAGRIVKDVMSDMTAERATEMQKGVAQVITAKVIQFASEGELTAKEINNIARAVKDCTSVAINADKYIQQQLAEKAKEAEKEISDIGKKKNIDPETLQIIREKIYGIVS